MNKRPIAIDLFAGAGGLSLGLEQAGFDVIAAVEIDPIHACIHKFNFPSCKVIAQSVSDINGDYIRGVCGISKKIKIDLVAGGAPCQGFSLIGQRAIDDPRNKLVKDFIRLINELQPSYFLFENVKGLTIGKHKAFLEEVIIDLERSGYSIVKPWVVLNAKNYNVPQSRERLFLMGAKKGMMLPSYPDSLKSIVTCAQALDDLPDAEAFSELTDTDEVSFKYLKRASGYSSLMRCTADFSWRFGYRRIWDKTKLTNSLRTDHSQISRHRFLTTIPGEVEPISRFYRLSGSGVSNTLRAGTDSSRGAFTSPRPIHYKHARCITVREMARLHGFPDWFRFHRTKWHGARQVGNAVPPPLAFAVASQIIKVIRSNLPEAPEEILKLGDPSLLNMDMSAASKFWGIMSPIAKRNMKSGSKKRKQVETQ